MALLDAYDGFNDKVTRLFLRFVGPPSVGDPNALPRGTSDEEQAREAELHDGFVRVVGPDGRSFLVPRD